MYISVYVYEKKEQEKGGSEGSEKIMILLYDTFLRSRTSTCFYSNLQKECRDRESWSWLEHE